MNHRIAQSRCSWLGLAVSAWLSALEPGVAATYQVGNTATNFSFIARRAFTRHDGTQVPLGARVSLHDFSGRIVFLEWFAVWCPFCVAAAPQVEAGIVDYYAERGGNPYGVPVLHIAVNQEARSFYQSQTDSFIVQQGFGIVVNDYDSTSTNYVRFLFQSSGQPIFAVINGVTNSPSHRPWQVLVNHLGYGDNDFSTELASFRAIIDTVQPPPPPARIESARHEPDDSFSFTLRAPNTSTWRVQYSADLRDWFTLTTVAGSTNGVAVRDTNAVGKAARFYRAQRQ